MTTTHDVAVIIGSLRRESLTRRAAHAAMRLAPPSLNFSIVEIRDLPLYDQDDEAHPSPAVAAFRDRVRAAEALLFVTPEYNRGIPGVLKNAIDVGSRPYGKNSWNGTPAALFSVSPGQYGGLASNQHLRLALAAVYVPAMADPEVYLGKAETLFDDQGGFKEEWTQKLMTRFMTNFAAWIERHAPARP